MSFVQLAPVAVFLVSQPGNLCLRCILQRMVHLISRIRSYVVSIIAVEKLLMAHFQNKFSRRTQLLQQCIMTVEESWRLWRSSYFREAKRRHLWKSFPMFFKINMRLSITVHFASVNMSLNLITNLQPLNNFSPPPLQFPAQNSLPIVLTNCLTSYQNFVTNHERLSIRPKNCAPILAFIAFTIRHKVFILHFLFISVMSSLSVEKIDLKT